MVLTISIEFCSLPPSRFLVSPISLRLEKRRIVSEAVDHLRRIEAIEMVPISERRQGVYSILFMVPKRNGDFRSILDLKFVNHHIRLRHFHMESLHSISEALQPDEFLTSLDLTEAYLHVPIHPSHRRYLRFCLDQQHFQFKALPFGLSTAPRVFTKLLVNPVSYLRLRGIHVHPYLDDLLIRSPSRLQAQQNTSLVIQCLSDHGFLVIKEKSHLIPSQRIKHLGVILDTWSSLPANG